MILALLVILALLDVDGAPAKPHLKTQCATYVPINLSNIKCQEIVSDMHHMAKSIIKGFTNVQIDQASDHTSASCTLKTFLDEVDDWQFKDSRCKFKQCLKILPEKCSVFKNGGNPCNNHNKWTQVDLPLKDFLNMVYANS